MDIDTPGDIGIVDATLGFHVYSNKGTINLASLGFGLSIDKYSKGNPISFGFSINQLLSTTITDKIIVDTLYNTIDPSVYNNLSNFETDVNSIKTKKSIKDCDVVIVKFGDKYKQWNAAFDAGYASALNKSIVVIHNDEDQHALKEVDASASAVAKDQNQVVRILKYILSGSL